MKKYRRRERGKERTFKKKKKKSKKKGPLEHQQHHHHNNTPSFISLADRCVCIYTYIDLLGRARADVVVTTVV